MPDELTLEGLIDDRCHELIVPHEHARLTAELATLRRDAALGRLVRALGHAALVRTPITGWRVDSFERGSVGVGWYAGEPAETPEAALEAHFARVGSLTAPAGTARIADEERLAVLARKAAALEDAYNLLIVLHARAAGGAATAAWAARVLDELGALFAAEEADHA